MLFLCKTFTVFTYYVYYLQVDFKLLEGSMLNGLSPGIEAVRFRQSEESNTMNQMTKSRMN